MTCTKRRRDRCGFTVTRSDVTYECSHFKGHGGEHSFWPFPSMKESVSKPMCRGGFAEPDCSEGKCEHCGRKQAKGLAIGSAQDRQAGESGHHVDEPTSGESAPASPAPLSWSCRICDGTGVYNGRPLRGNETSIDDLSCDNCNGTGTAEPRSNNPGFERLVDDYGDDERRAGDYYALGAGNERSIKAALTVSRTALLKALWTVEWERDKAQEWLREHGEHRPSCDRAGGFTGLCDCGLERVAGRNNA